MLVVISCLRLFLVTKVFRLLDQLDWLDDNFVYIEGVITLRNGLSYTELIISLNFPIKSFPHNFHICVTDERILNMEYAEMGFIECVGEIIHATMCSLMR